MSRYFCLLAMFLSGCANLASISRSTDLPDGGKAIHLDASQRLVYANKQGMLCAEPTPDALQSYAAAMGASLGVTDASAKAVSQAFSTNSASIGLHTQSITLMRDTLYRICEYSHNAGNSLDVVQLLQRSQDLTLGVLAIEQITGAVVARQIALTKGSSSDAAANMNNVRAQLDLAKKNEAEKKVELAATTETEEVQKIKSDEARAAEKAEAAKGADGDAEKLKSLSATTALEASKLKKLADATAEAKLARDRAVVNSEAIGNMLAGALAATKASTNGDAVFLDPMIKPVSMGSGANEIADAAVRIVDVLVNKGHMTDICMNFLTRVSDRPYDSSPALAMLTEQCAAVIKTNMAILQQGPQNPPPQKTKYKPPPIELKGSLEGWDCLKDPDSPCK